MTWLTAGTVTVATGSDMVLGAGTNFGAAAPGDMLVGPDDRLYRLTAITNDGHLTIAPAYRGASGAGQSYSILLVSLSAAGLADSLRATRAAYDAVLAGGRLLPVGVIAPYAGVSLPQGWLWCAGQLVSRSDYPALHAAIGSTYGAGDGATTFQVPDLRGRVAAGRDNMGGSVAGRLATSISGSTLGAAGGAEQHLLDISEIPHHAHPMPTGVSAGIAANPGRYIGASYTDIGSLDTDTSFDNAVGGGQSHPILQPTLVVNHIIYTGV
ncbi:hypothetical protein N825_25475 [Skermanella stibiiresistens SB22]|uniref:Phage tail collar domain-containing protein n=1 Tax=Skermanella stibiiresistens SB22 TaxID=1385369 RepID=W9GZ80_9PROT|nr:tail fiber protein [Skermanella stibiiresistens]EWY36788.1 hypothetical protein N825_25475 [Skermanella stibiiresistens SB22]